MSERSYHRATSRSTLKWNTIANVNLPMYTASPVVEEPLEVLEEGVLVLVDEGDHRVDHIARVVFDAEVLVVLHRLVRGVQLEAANSTQNQVQAV